MACLGVSIRVVPPLEPAARPVVMMEVVVATGEALLVSEQLVGVHQGHLSLEDVGRHVAEEEPHGVGVTFQTPERVRFAVEILAPVVCVA